MFRLPASRKSRFSRDARALAGRGLHRAEELRESLPEAADVLSDLREQAQPVVEAAREQAGRVRHRGRNRSRKPMILAVLIAVGVAVAYLLFSRRDKEPAFLMPAPQTPAAPAADDLGPGGTDPGGAQEPSAPVVDEAAERPTYRAPEPVVAPTAQATPASPAQATEAISHGTFRPDSNGAYGGPQPRAQAEWDLPSHGNPPHGNAVAGR